MCLLARGEREGGASERGPRLRGPRSLRQGILAHHPHARNEECGGSRPVSGLVWIALLGLRLQLDQAGILLTNPPFGGQEEQRIEPNFPAHFRTRDQADLFLALIIRLLKQGGHAAKVLPDGSL